METRIKNMLLSSDPEVRGAGLALLDGEYRESVSAYVRNWANTNRVWITKEDLADAWQATMTILTTKVKRREFKFEGDLRAYLRTIACRRAIDILRQRIPVDHSNVEALEEICCPACQLHLLEAIKAAFSKMSEKLRLVLIKDVVLFLRNFKWVSLNELTEEVNKGLREPLKRSTVKSRRARARQELRNYLKDWE